MKNIVVPINDARDTRWAVAQVIEQYRSEPVNVHLLNVRHPLPLHVSRFFKGTGTLDEFYRDAGTEVLKPAVEALTDAGIPHQTYVLVGDKAETIVRFARTHQCEIVLDDRSKSVLSFLGLGSMASRVARLMHADAQSSRVSNPT